jgi:hypothetical protein
VHYRQEVGTASSRCWTLLATLRNQAKYSPKIRERRKTCELCQMPLSARVKNATTCFPIQGISLGKALESIHCSLTLRQLLVYIFPLKIAIPLSLFSFFFLPHFCRKLGSSGQPQCSNCHGRRFGTSFHFPFRFSSNQMGYHMVTSRVYKVSLPMFVSLRAVIGPQ